MSDIQIHPKRVKDSIALAKRIKIDNQAIIRRNIFYMLLTQIILTIALMIANITYNNVFDKVFFVISDVLVGAFVLVNLYGLNATYCAHRNKLTIFRLLYVILTIIMFGDVIAEQIILFRTTTTHLLFYLIFIWVFSILIMGIYTVFLVNKFLDVPRKSTLKSVLTDKNSYEKMLERSLIVSEEDNQSNEHHYYYHDQSSPLALSLMRCEYMQKSSNQHRLRHYK